MAEQTLGDTMSAIAILHADRVRHGRLWEVEFDGEMVVIGSRDPEFDLARVLLARGRTGKVTILDGKTGRPRTIINDVEKAAGLRTEEGPYGPRFVKWRQTSVDHSYTGEIALAGTQQAPARRASREAALLRLQRRTAAVDSTDPTATGEKILTARLTRRREVMERRGIQPEAITGELAALECAIRCKSRLLTTGAVA